MKIELVHSFDVSRATYEKNINHPELLRRCEGRLPYLRSRTLVEGREGPGPDQYFWRFRCEADYALPEAAKRVIGDRLGWFEDTVFDRREHACRFKIVSDVLQKRYRCQGEQLFVERSDGGLDRLMTVDLTVDILLVGRTVERHIAEKLRETYSVEHEIQRGFFADLARGVPSSTEGRP